MPCVSVIIPTYNRRDYVQEAIDSVLAQTHTDYEIIVVDDGSTDGTGEALRARYGDRIRYVWQENQGESVARNRGIEMAQGEYVAFLDSDDLWLPEKLEKEVPVLEASHDAVLVFTPAWPVDAGGQRLSDIAISGGIDRNKLTLEALCMENALGSAGSTALVRRGSLERVGGFDRSIRYSEDWDLWLRLRQRGCFAFVQEPLAHIRQHAGSQFHGRDPKSLDKRLISQMRILQKTFENWPGKVPDGLHARALASLHGRISFVYYAVGLPVEGRRKLEEAIHYDAESWGDAHQAAERLTHEMMNMALINGQGARAVLYRAHSALEHWPRSMPLPSEMQSRVLGKLCAGLAFAFHRLGDARETRFWLLQAIRHDHNWLRNVGIWSIGVEVFLGEHPAGWLRSLGRIFVKPGKSL